MNAEEKIKNQNNRNELQTNGAGNIPPATTPDDKPPSMGWVEFIQFRFERVL